MKNTSIPSLSGMYINGETAIVSNMEITLEMQLGCSAESPILIPLRAFDMIKSLPEGILDIQQDEKFQVTIKSEKQRVRFAGFDPRTFDRQKNIPEGESVTLPGGKADGGIRESCFRCRRYRSKSHPEGRQHLHA